MANRATIGLRFKKDIFGRVIHGGAYILLERN